MSLDQWWRGPAQAAADGTVVLPLTDIGCLQGSAFMAAFDLTWMMVQHDDSSWNLLQLHFS